MATLATTIDLDGAAVYGAVHDIATVGSDFNPFGKPLDRFLDLMSEIGLRPTLFVTGMDVRRCADTLRTLDPTGTELASHSNDHDFSLSVRSPERIRADFERTQHAFEDTLGRRPSGFRAPGYLMSPALLDAVEQAGMEWDSSIFPSPSYYLLKAGVLSAYHLRNRSPASRIGRAQVMVSPREPYRPGASPFRRGPRDIWELPIADAFGLPMTGAAIALMPRWLLQRALRRLARREHLVLNFHAMDFATHDEVSSAIASRQPELGVPWEERHRRYTEVLAACADNRRSCTCSQVVTELT